MAQLCRDIKGHGNPTGHRPELILNNFNTRLGKRLGRMIAALFPLDPQFKGRRVVTCHNQRDFLFFRHHRYIFEEGKKKRDGPVRARLQELGPQFTLKLRVPPAVPAEPVLLAVKEPNPLEPPEPVISI